MNCPGSHFGMTQKLKYKIMEAQNIVDSNCCKFIYSGVLIGILCLMHTTKKENSECRSRSAVI